MSTQKLFSYSKIKKTNILSLSGCFQLISCREGRLPKLCSSAALGGCHNIQRRNKTPADSTHSHYILLTKHTGSQGLETGKLNDQF